MDRVCALWVVVYLGPICLCNVFIFQVTEGFSNVMTVCSNMESANPVLQQNDRNLVCLTINKCIGVLLRRYKKHRLAARCWHIVNYLTNFIRTKRQRHGVKTPSLRQKLNHLIPTLKPHSNWTIIQYSDWYTGRWSVGCYIWYSEKGHGRAGAPPSPLLAVSNVSAHPSTAVNQLHVIWCGTCLWTLKG